MREDKIAPVRAEPGPSRTTASPGTDVPTGNTFDKYGSTNPVVRRLMAGFHSTLDELWAAAAPESVLDVGCGEGVLTASGHSAWVTGGSWASISTTPS